jgi:hypothetical protein
VEPIRGSSQVAQSPPELHEAKLTREEADKKGSRQIPSNDLLFMVLVS